MEFYSIDPKGSPAAGPGTWSLRAGLPAEPIKQRALLLPGHLAAVWCFVVAGSQGKILIQ